MVASVCLGGMLASTEGDGWSGNGDVSVRKIDLEFC